MAELRDVRCCGWVEVRRVRELPHTYGFDFDLFQCAKCGSYWVSAFGVSSISSWEKASDEDAEKMNELPWNELQAFIREWARSFD